MFQKSECGKFILYMQNKEIKYEFDISKKRVYHSIMDLMVTDLNIFTKLNPEFLENFLEMKDVIDAHEITDRDEFRDVLVETFISNPPFKDFLFQYVIDNYTITIESKNKNEELQFTDNMAKMISTISLFCRLLIPLITDFLAQHNLKDDKLFIECFSEIYKIIDKDENGESIDIANKLNKFVCIQVDNTLYSDQVIWNYLKNVSTTPNTFAIELFRRIMRDTVPKLELNKSVVSYLHVVLKHQLMFLFTQNIKINFKPIIAIRTDNESSSQNATNPFAKLEQKLVKANEGNYLLNKNAICEYIQENRVIKDSDALDFYIQNVTITTLQIRLLNYFANKYIGNGIDIYHCNKSEYVHILLILEKWLTANKFTFLAQALMAVPFAKSSKKNFNKGNLLASITESKSYENILKKYTVIKSKILENKLIVNFIGEILNTDFEPFTKYNEPTNSFSFNDYPIKNSISEILAFIERY